MNAELASLIDLARAMGRSVAGGGHGVRDSTDPIDDFDRFVGHPVLAAASRSLFKDGYYSESVEKGQKALIQHVQERSKTSLDGSGLMTRVFSRANPILQLNELKTRAEQDEQEGYMHFFQGAVLMIRNPRTHNYRHVDSSEHALRLLAFTSHLFDMVDSAQFKRVD